MNILPLFKNNCLTIKVIPNAKISKAVMDNNPPKIYLQAVPEKNKANLELIKFFKKEFGVKVMIQSGEKSREKVVCLAE
ncbi:MAG: DUF167 domain-containing protein [Nanoarchaeota archaeon]|nr:DUF167 domain-containing protein [Nanoarchaeota archaeon]